MPQLGDRPRLRIVDPDAVHVVAPGLEQEAVADEVDPADVPGDQFGVEDQGWLAWFAIANLTGRKITIYGDGKQIRDVLYVSDLVAAYRAAIEHQEAASGQARAHSDSAYWQGYLYTHPL